MTAVTTSGERNVAVVRGLLEAIRARDEQRFAAAYAEDAVARTAGIPRANGGVLEGRAAIVEHFRHEAPRVYEVRELFADDTHACLVAKLSSVFASTPYFQGNDQPYSTYECVVYRIADGRIAEQASYVNKMDVYIQVGLVDLDTLTA